MKALFTTLIALILSLQLAAQDTPTAKPEYVYCEIIGTQPALTDKLTVYVDFGQPDYGTKVNNIADPATGKMKVFLSMMEAVNYMIGRGWEYVDAYSSSGSNVKIYHYIMKKKL